MKRTIALGAAWTASAAAAVGLGFLAVSLVDASAAPATQTVAASPAASTGSSPTAAAPAATSGERTTVGGTVFASCAGGIASLAGAPATGWWVDDSAGPGEVEFENGSQKVEVRTACVGDVPQFSVEGPRADDASTSPAAPSTGFPSPSSGQDDSSGRGGGGHGSDDPPGGDSSGRGGGGHGSDG